MSGLQNGAPDYAGHSGAHTAGPWRVERHDGYIPEEWGVEPIQVVGADGEVIACNTAFYPTGLAAKNAHLIAAAPDMKDSGTDLLASLDPEQLNPEQFNAWCRLRAAIAKAECRS